jgi:hypothetical protein
MARGRKSGFVMSDEHRVKIQNSNILNALIEHVQGEREMSATQVSAGVALLRKVMPDLSSTEASVEHSGGIEVRASKEQRDAAVSAALRADTDA